MKKIFLLTVIVLLSAGAYAQKETKARLSAKQTMSTTKHHVHVCQLKAYPAKDGSMKIMVDLGDVDTFSDLQVKEIKMEDYTAVHDNMVDALRFMRAKGWRMSESYSYNSEKGEVINIIMKRK